MNLVADFGVHAQPLTRVDTCPVHGEFESKCRIRSIWTKCPACSAESEAREKAEREATEREARKDAWLRKIDGAGIPDRFQTRSLQIFVADTAPKARVLAFATNYADTFDDVLSTGRCALFVGGPGTGKTHLAVGIGLRIMHRDNRMVLFSTALRAIRRVKETWGRESRESETQAIAAMVLPDLLILDEVGVQFGSDTEKLILFDVLNERYERRRPTLLLSNLDIDGVSAFLGERIFDRLREDGGEVVVFDWPSHRGG